MTTVTTAPRIGTSAYADGFGNWTVTASALILADGDTEAAYVAAERTARARMMDELMARAPRGQSQAEMSAYVRRTARVTHRRPPFLDAARREAVAVTITEAPA